MDAVTHLLVGRLLAEALGPATPLGVLAQVFAVLPDVDTITWAVPRLRRWLRHRGATHSLLFGALASLVAAGIATLAADAPFLLAAVVSFAAFLTHVALDVLHWGCQLLWPFSPRHVEHTVHGGLQASAMVSSAGFVLVLVLPWTALPIGLALVAYFATRIVLRWRAERRHGRRVYPTANPLVWVMAE